MSNPFFLVNRLIILKYSVLVLKKNFFRIDDSTGEIFTSGNIDREKHGVKFILQLMAIQDGGNSACKVKIQLIFIFVIQNIKCLFLRLLCT